MIRNERSKMRFINPEIEGVHPRRLTMSDEEMGEVLQGIVDNEDWMSLEEIEAAQDHLFDYIVAEKQTVEGVTTLQ